ncbi:MAG: carboxypeptidase regulatory-like domain-containing protein, partial [Planctomycetes bacterium]|nr:carboxypeptidase regulatory-like domain-containing protein [Planctomycetota bacterium]
MNLPESVCAGVAQISSMPAWAVLLSKATLLLAVAWLIHFALARANPRWRVLLWRGGVVGLALLVVWSLGLPGLEVRVPAPEAVAIPPSEALPPVVADSAPIVFSQADVFSTEMPASTEMTTSAPQTSVDAGHDTTQPVNAARPSLSWQAALLSLWCLGMALLLARLAIGYLRLARELSTLQAPPEWVLAEVRRVAGALGCRRAVRVRSSRRFAVPFLCGLRYPVLVLPERMCRPEYRSQLPGIVTHELAHVRSWDFGWNACLQVVSIMLWFHPLAWRIGSAHRAACDAVCDAVSASYLGDVAGYCQTLARVALEGAASAPAVGLAMARSCDVRRRITLLQRRVFAAALGRRSAVAFASVGLLSFALLAGLRLALAESAPQEAPDQAAVASTPEAPRPAPKHQEPPPTVSGESIKPGFRPMRIRVLDPEGKPIADAGVTVRGMTHIPSGPARYRTNAEGIATIEFQEHKDLSLQVLAWADRRVTVGAHWRASAVEKTIPAKYTLTLEPGTTFGGTIRDEQGRPVAGAEVTVGGHKQSGDGVLGWSIYDTSQTDAEGKWQCHRVPADLTGFDLNLKVRHPDFANMPRQDLDTQSVDEFRGKTAVTVMRVGIVVEGTVTDPNGKPVAGAFVEQSVDRFPPGYPPATTDQDGRYRLPVSDPGEYVLAVAAEGHVPNARRVTVSAEERQFDLQLLEGKPIRLRVVDQDGKPLAAALVNTGLDREALSVENTRTAMPGGDRNLSTDAEGRWSRLWIPNDKLTFSISKPGYARVQKSFAPDDEEHVVTLESGGWTLAGRVVDLETKAPVTEFRVLEGIAPGGEGSRVIWRESRPAENDSGQFLAHWDTSGNPRRVVRIEADGYLPSESRWLKVDEKQATFNVELEKGQTITGVVLSPDGKPLADADVALCTSSRGLYLRNGRPGLDQLPLLARTGPHGRFSFTPQREPYALVAVHEQGFAQAEDEQGMKELTLQ